MNSGIENKDKVMGIAIDKEGNKYKVIVASCGLDTCYCAAKAIKIWPDENNKDIQIKFGLHSAEESLLEEIARIKAYCNKHNILVKEIILEVPISLHKHAEEAIKRIDSEKKLSIRIGNFQENKNKWELCIRVKLD